MEREKMDLPVNVKKSEKNTIEFINNLSENERAELIDGEVYYMAPPLRIHQKIVVKIVYELEKYIRENNGSCEVYPAPFGVYLEDDIFNYFEPDVSVVCDKDKLNEKGCTGAPDLVVEVLSESTRKKDLFVKVGKYQEIGVRECWLVDVANEKVVKYNFMNENVIPEIFGFGARVPVSIYKGNLQIDTSGFKE